MKTYVITLSKVFQKSHRRSGEPTNFADNFRKTKIHTIRTNYKLWRKRFDEIENGAACLSIRQWEGKPYRSKQVEIAKLTKEDGIGLQRLTLYSTMFGNISAIADDVMLDLETLATNDGLDFKDWIGWFDTDKMLSFANYDNSLSLIHFTKFRYSYEND